MSADATRGGSAGVDRPESLPLTVGHLPHADELVAHDVELLLRERPEQRLTLGDERPVELAHASDPFVGELDHDLATVDYEAARRERVEKVVAYGARSSSAKIPGTIGRAARDTFLRVAFRYLITDRGLDWMHGHRIDWDGPLPTARRALATV
jgi:hypothetical protein